MNRVELDSLLATSWPTPTVDTSINNAAISRVEIDRRRICRLMYCSSRDDVRTKALVTQSYYNWPENESFGPVIAPVGSEFEAGARDKSWKLEKD